MWAPRGSRPAAPKQTAYANLHVLSAVCPATGAAEGLVAESLDTRTVQALLDQLSASLPGGVHVVLVWDGAGYHSASKALVVPANATPVTLPPYPRTQPGGAAVAVRPRALLGEPGVRGLRGPGARRAGRLAEGLPGRRAHQDALPLRAPAGGKLINGMRISRLKRAGAATSRGFTDLS